MQPNLPVVAFRPPILVALFPTAPQGELWLRDRRDGGLGLESWFGAEHGAMLRSLTDQLAVSRPPTASPTGAASRHGRPMR